MLGIKGRHVLMVLTANWMRQNEERKWTDLADEGRGENCEETEQFQKQPKPSPAGVLLRLQGSWGPLFACSLQKKKKKERERKNLLSANIVGPVMEDCHLDRFYTFQKIWNYDPMT